MIRKATIKDSAKIQKLINFYAKGDEMLPRSINELYENVRDFFIFEQKGKIIGCCALHICWEDLGEIKSLAVIKSKHGQGIGTKLLEACLNDAKKLKLKKLFALTYKPMYFKKFGFKEIDKAALPHKIWTDCIKCVKFPDCDEVALIREI
ncbi:MAG: N-acetyltransferase [Candidatus Omnitrophica bacterium]|nr:N-acetyltransferase [Candidatus Omnitrophota bacterium]